MHHKNPHPTHGHDRDRHFARGDRDHAERRGGPNERRFHRGGHRHRSHRGNRDLHRFFAHGDPRLVILRLIEEKPRHGHEIIQEIADRAGGAYSPGPGMIYPTLTMLEEPGYVVVVPGDGARKLRTITDEGRVFLTANHQAVDALSARMARPPEDASDDHASRTFRAMKNLGMAVRLRLARGPLPAARGPDRGDHRHAGGGLCRDRKGLSEA